MSFYCAVPLEKKLALSLLSLRVTIAVVFIVWALDNGSRTCIKSIFKFLWSRNISWIFYFYRDYTAYFHFDFSIRSI